jgi:hypothetical protein
VTGWITPAGPWALLNPQALTFTRPFA